MCCHTKKYKKMRDVVLFLLEKIFNFTFNLHYYDYYYHLKKNIYTWYITFNLDPILKNLTVPIHVFNFFKKNSNVFPF